MASQRRASGRRPNLAELQFNYQHSLMSPHELESRLSYAQAQLEQTISQLLLVPRHLAQEKAAHTATATLLQQLQEEVATYQSQCTDSSEQIEALQQQLLEKEMHLEGIRKDLADVEHLRAELLHLFGTLVSNLPDLQCKVAEAEAAVAAAVEADSAVAATTEQLQLLQHAVVKQQSTELSEQIKNLQSQLLEKEMQLQGQQDAQLATAERLAAAENDRSELLQLISSLQHTNTAGTTAATVDTEKGIATMAAALQLQQMHCNAHLAHDELQLLGNFDRQQYAPASTAWRSSASEHADSPHSLQSSERTVTAAEAAATIAAMPVAPVMPALVVQLQELQHQDDAQRHQSSQTLQQLEAYQQQLDVKELQQQEEQKTLRVIEPEHHSFKAAEDAGDSASQLAQSYTGLEQQGVANKTRPVFMKGELVNDTATVLAETERASSASAAGAAAGSASSSAWCELVAWAVLAALQLSAHLIVLLLLFAAALWAVVPVLLLLGWCGALYLLYNITVAIHSGAGQLLQYSQSSEQQNNSQYNSSSGELLCSWGSTIDDDLHRGVDDEDAACCAVVQLAGSHKND